MGIRSDVGIALTKDVVLPEAIKKFLSQADEMHVDPAGTLYVFEQISWSSSNKEVGQFMVFYNALPSEHYLVVEACNEYPDPNSVDGAWGDNPWGLCQVISASLHYR